MSVSSNNSNDRMATNSIEFDSERPTDRRSSMLNIQPELTKIVRKLLPYELSLNTHVRNVDYFEPGCKRLSGTLYMTIFRLIFAPDNELEENNIIISGNQYIGEYDIPLTSIYKINVSPMESRSTLRSLLGDTQIQSEMKSFTILTRDFRNITFSKTVCKNVKSETSVTKMETYIKALRVHTRFQDKTQLYPHITVQRLSINSPSLKTDDDYAFFSSDSLIFHDNLPDFCISNDERIKSYMMYQHWQDELNAANELRWEVDGDKFDSNNIAKDEAPFTKLQSSNITSEDKRDLIWHWTHTSDFDNQQDPARRMLVTILGIADVPNPNESRRRSTIESTLHCSGHFLHDEHFHRYNLAKFPCSLKQLQDSFEKLIELCTTYFEEDDEKWLTKLNACRWLRYVSKALQGAATIAKSLNFKSVQLAGSDIDNSCLMSSLIQIFIRPQCRTIKGFCELITREWIIPGHPFRERFGQIHSDNDKNSAQESPIFLLFLDCVYQLLVQNPSLFQFTEYFLIEIYHNVCYCYQHTFAFNTVNERLTAIETCPENVLILSAFDFSLYMNTDICHLIKNHASVFMPKKQQPPPTMPRTRLPPTTSTKMSQIHNLLKENLNFNLSQSAPIGRKSTKLVSPTSESSVPPPPPPISDLLRIKPEQFKYEHIEAPQKFADDLYVDWRLFNIVLWSKCYCRYDQNHMPTLFEHEISAELNSFEQRRLNKTSNKSQEQMASDPLNSIQCANSWHPRILVTRV